MRLRSSWVPGTLGLLTAGCLLAAAASGACKREDRAQSSVDEPPDLGLREGAARIATTQGTLTVGDQSLVERFPLPVIPDARVDHVGQFEQPGEPLTLQMTVESSAPMEKVADYYENALRGKGLRVQRSQSPNDPNQIILMGESGAATATALVNAGSGDRPTSASLTWTEKLIISGAPVETRATKP